ncbi:unnamed protein product [Caretta caretta]
MLSLDNALEHRAGSAQPREQEQQFLTPCDLSVPPEPNSPLLDTQGSLFEQPLSQPELATFTDSELDIQQQVEFSPPASPPPPEPLPHQVTAHSHQPQFPYFTSPRGWHWVLLPYALASVVPLATSSYHSSSDLFYQTTASCALISSSVHF